MVDGEDPRGEVAVKVPRGGVEDIDDDGIDDGGMAMADPSPDDVGGGMVDPSPPPMKVVGSGIAGGCDINIA